MEPTCQQAAVVIVLTRQPALVSPVTVLEELEKKVKVKKKRVKCTFGPLNVVKVQL
jgi:hypothetical protein